jgi:hypothetical protein
LSDYLERVDIMSTEVDDDGVVRAKLGDKAEDNLGITDGVALWPCGAFVSRPADPTAAPGACEALMCTEGSSRYAVNWRDNRMAAKAGALAPGDSAILSNSAARVLVKQGEAAVSLYTESGLTGSSMIVELNGAGEKFTVLAGKAVIQATPGPPAALVLQLGGSQITMSEQSIALNAQHVAINGATVSIGLVPGLGVPPVAPANAAVTGPPAVPPGPHPLSTTVTIAP